MIEYEPVGLFLWHNCGPTAPLPAPGLEAGRPGPQPVPVRGRLRPSSRSYSPPGAMTPATALAVPASAGCTCCDPDDHRGCHHGHPAGPASRPEFQASWAHETPHYGDDRDTLRSNGSSPPFLTSRMVATWTSVPVRMPRRTQWARTGVTAFVSATRTGRLPPGPVRPWRVELSGVLKPQPLGVGDRSMHGYVGPVQKAHRWQLELAETFDRRSRREPGALGHPAVSSSHAPVR